MYHHGNNKDNNGYLTLKFNMTGPPVCAHNKQTSTATVVTSHDATKTDRHPFSGLFSRTTWVIQYQKG